MRGATGPAAETAGRDAFQSTHPVRGATSPNPETLAKIAISIHAPRAGCDGCVTALHRSRLYFNPRTPCGVRLEHGLHRAILVNISIHAPRAGCDLGRGTTPKTPADFNPRTPCGVRRCYRLLCCQPLAFQSTHPVRGATTFLAAVASPSSYFNPRTPCGVRRAILAQQTRATQISIHAPRAGCDLRGKAHADAWSAFQSTHPVRGATVNNFVDSAVIADFNPRTPCGVRQATLCRLRKETHFNPRTPCGVRRAVGSV